jgi:hypothetical protein
LAFLLYCLILRGSLRNQRPWVQVPHRPPNKTFSGSLQYFCHDIKLFSKRFLIKIDDFEKGPYLAHPLSRLCHQHPEEESDGLGVILMKVDRGVKAKGTTVGSEREGLGPGSLAPLSHEDVIEILVVPGGG